MTVQQPFDGRIELGLSLILSSDAYVSEWFPRLGFHMSESAYTRNASLPSRLIFRDDQSFSGGSPLVQSDNDGIGEIPEIGTSRFETLIR